MDKFNNRVALRQLRQGEAVVVEADTNVAGKLTGYFIFRQSDRYAIGSKEDADMLRRNGFLVDNRLI